MAKAFVFLLGIEGIESKRVIYHNGEHEYVCLKINNNWYLSDPYFGRNEDNYVSYQNLFHNITETAKTLQNHGVIVEEKGYEEFYSNINYKGVSVIIDNRDDFDAIKNMFDTDGINQSVNFLINVEQYDDIIEYVIEIGYYNYVAARNYFGALSLGSGQYKELIIQKI